MAEKYNRVLITGAGGMLGNAVYPYIAKRCEHVLATDQNETERLSLLDVRDPDAVRRTIDQFQPNLILHLAANTDLEHCELNPEFASENNALPSLYIGAAARDIGARLVYISTAGVFDGGKTDPYVETDEARPLMVYGQSKLDGEINVLKECPEALVLRAGWMVGGGPAIDHKFVSLILNQLAEGKTLIHAVNDKLGTPTYTYDFAANLFALLGTDAAGIFHMVCEGTGSRFDVACEIVSICGRDDVTVEPVSSDFFKERFFAPRPKSEMMINARLRAMDLNKMRHWKDALRDYITRYFSASMVSSPSTNSSQSRATR